MKTLKLKTLRLLLCTALFCPPLSNNAHALIPVTDAGTLAQSIENNINLALELKSVKNVVELAGKMNTTIGEALSTFNEYVATYNKYKDMANSALSSVSGTTNLVDDVLGTNISDAVDNVGGAYNKVTSIGDSVANLDITSPTAGTGMTSELSGSGTNNGFAILPNELANYCGITATDIKNLDDKPKVVECLKKLITYRNSKDKDAQRDARDIYVKSFHETAYANVAEAVVMRNYAVNYEREVLDPLTEQLKEAKTVRDDYSGVIMVNKEIANLVNKLLMMYSSKVAYDAFRDYGDFEIYAEDILNIGDSGK